jgi:hypothetical protein
LVMKVEIPGDCGGDGGVKVDGRESIDNIAAVTRGIVDVEDAKNVVAILEVNDKGVCMVEDVGLSGGRETRDASSNVDQDAGMTSCRRFEKVPGGVGHPAKDICAVRVIVATQCTNPLVPGFLKENDIDLCESVQ